MPQPPRNDGWKHTPKPNPAKPPATNPAPNTSRKQWQPGAPKAKTTGKKTPRAVKFVAAGVGVGLLTTVVVIVILLLQPPNYTTVVVVAPDTDTLALPENAAGVNSAKGIEEWATGKERAGLAAGRDATADRDAWKASLEKNSAGAGVVLYFAAHAGADEKGPYLWLPPKSGAVSEADKLRVETILQRLAELPKGKPKLLVFDVAQTPANWVFGGAYSDFVQALKVWDQKIKDVPELAVLCSADEGQVSWVAEERRKSAFGHYFLEGLKGDAGTPGGKLTAAGLHVYLKKAVQNWAVGNRGVSQEPILLPDGGLGTERAEKIELATLPPTAYSAPPEPDKPPQTPTPLTDEWKEAEKLAALSPPPDTTDPLRWRQYLEWLLRWERLVRLGAVPPDLPKTVQGLREELKRPAAAGVPSRVVALPAGPALSGMLVSASDADAKRFISLWSPIKPSTHETEWAKLGDDPEVRTAAFRFVVDQVLTLGVSKETLAVAEAVLEAEGGKVQPVEVHYLRMLHRHLPDDPKRWPPADLLATAIKLRRTAEQAAWAEGHVYPEQALRWTRKLVTDADDTRQLGEDQLFDTTPDSWTQARTRFAESEKKYKEAQERVAVVTDALARRDKVFARLPYYARWVAAPRGGPDSADALVALLEQAAKAAHEIDRLCGQLPFKPDEADLGERLTELKKQAADAKRLDEVADRYARLEANLGNQVQASNWHALEAARGVPFRSTEADRDLGKLARTVAAKLADEFQQRSGLPPQATDWWASASRNLRAAAAYMKEPAVGRNTDGPKPGGAWWEVPRGQAEQLAAAFRGLPAKAGETIVKADAEGTQLSEVSREYADAARFARLTDPAVPAGGTPTPPEADRRYWRHYLLLRQAERIIRDGWCGTSPAESNPVKWYSTTAADLVRAAADGELNALVPGRVALSIEDARRKRLDRDWNTELQRQPTELTVTADPARVVVPDERRLQYAYRVGVKRGDRVGFPVTEYRLPPALAKANPGTGERVLETRLPETPADKTLKTDKTFALSKERAGDGKPEPLAAAVRYRGRVYNGTTAITFAGPPNRVVQTVPASGQAVMGLQADPEAISGAVTILIDITQSMVDRMVGDRTRLREAFDGVERLLEVVPPGTQVIIGTFVGDGGTGKSVLVVKTVVSEFQVDGSDDQRAGVMKQVKKVTAVDPSYTPVAGAIEFALNTKTGKGLWPKSFTGGRTLIILTDGEDTWDVGAGGYTRKGQAVEPGEVVREAVAQAVADDKAPDVNVYVTLFGLGEDKQSKDAKATAKKQFGAVGAVLDNDGQVQGRGRFELFPDAKDATKFADLLADAVMPRVRYRATQGKVSDVMVATNPKKRDYRPTVALDAKPLGSTFDLRMFDQEGFETAVVQLTSGERMLIRAVRENGQLKLTRPAFAFELASAVSDKDGDPRPFAKPDRIALTLPRLEYVPRGENGTLSATLTLEEPISAKDRALSAASRQYAWIDVAAADGKEYDSAMTVYVRNHLEPDGNELLAPAWDVTVTGEFKDQGNARKFRRPAVAAYWGKGWPKDNLGRLERSADQVRRTQDGSGTTRPFNDFGGGKAEVLDAAVVEADEVREGGRVTTAKGTYLRVWLATPDDKRVFLRAGGWERPVGEKHSYYDPHRRYTAEFGPLTAEDLKAPLSFELYTVDALRANAAAEGGKVELEANPNASELRLPPRLLMNPKK